MWAFCMSSKGGWRMQVRWKKWLERWKGGLMLAWGNWIFGIEREVGKTPRIEDRLEQVRTTAGTGSWKRRKRKEEQLYQIFSDCKRCYSWSPTNQIRNRVDTPFTFKHLQKGYRLTQKSRTTKVAAMQWSQRSEKEVVSSSSDDSSHSSS